MNSSQVSQGSTKSGSKFILRDTMGPTNSGAASGYAASGSSSSTSSVRELSSAEAQGLRSSFRVHDQGNLLATAASEQGYPLADNQEPGTSVSIDDVHVLGVRGDEIRGATPDSTASSTKRFFLNVSGQAQQYSVGNLKPSMAVSMREQISTLGARPDRGTPPFDATPGRSTHEHANAGFTGTEDETTNGSVLQDDNSKLPDKEEKPGSCLPRCGLLGLVTVIVMAGVILLIFLAKEKEPDKKRGAIIHEKDPVKGKRKRHSC